MSECSSRPVHLLWEGELSLCAAFCASITSSLMETAPFHAISVPTIAVPTAESEIQFPQTELCGKIMWLRYGQQGFPPASASPCLPGNQRRVSYGCLLPTCATQILSEATMSRKYQLQSEFESAVPTTDLRLHDGSYLNCDESQLFPTLPFAF